MPYFSVFTCVQIEELNVKVKAQPKTAFLKPAPAVKVSSSVFFKEEEYYADLKAKRQAEKARRAKEKAAKAQAKLDAKAQPKIAAVPRPSWKTAKSARDMLTTSFEEAGGSDDEQPSSPQGKRGSVKGMGLPKRPPGTGV